MTHPFGRSFVVMASLCRLAACNAQSSSPGMPTLPDAEQQPHIVSAPAGDRRKGQLEASVWIVAVARSQHRRQSVVA